MTLRSMTGFGEGTAEQGAARASATVRAVNHKTLDVRTSLPARFVRHERALVKRVSALAHRGRIEIRVTVTGAAGEGVRVLDVDAARDTHAALTTLATSLQTPPPSLSDVMGALGPGLWMDAADRLDEDDGAAAIVAATADALAAFVAFREREGAELARELSALVDALETALGSIGGLAAAANDAHRERLRAKVEALIAGGVAPERLEQEVVLVAERSDVAEEIQRAGMHVAALRDLLAGPGPHGKRMDFLLQELIRETNTMASKSVSAELTQHVVDAKTHIERLREQAHNVE